MNTDVNNRYIWLGGEIVHLPDAKINVLSPTSQFGLNVFEGIPGYWNEDEKQLYVFRLEDHYKRLMKSAKLLQIDCPYTVDELKNALISVVKANDYRENISVRQTLFVDGFGSWGSSDPVNMFVAPVPKGGMSKEYNRKGLNCCITSWRRIGETNLSPRIKCGANYINSRAGQREALRNGYDTCIFLNEFGKIAEGPGSCFFMVKDGKLVTPLLTDGVLESITRDTVIKLAKRSGIEVEERSIDRTELYAADEAFLCGSAMEVTPVLSVDKYEVGNGETGKITDSIHKLYLDAARGKIAELRDWVTGIY